MTEPQSPPDLEAQALVNAAGRVWMRRLIDHSRANSLLFYRDLKVGTLDLTSEHRAVERLLAGETLTTHALVTSISNADNPDPVIRQRVETETQAKLRSTLVALQRKALSNFDEKGIETLHLAVGIATWPADDGGRPYNAPVLLIPARIETRQRAGNDIRLVVSGEPQLNPVLGYVLEESHAVRLNGQGILAECGSEGASGEWRVDPTRVLDRVAHIAADIPGFEVTPRVVLANFQFAKMAMVEDIKKNGAAMAASAVVRAIAGHQPSRQLLAQRGDDLAPGDVDKRPAGNDFLVLDADSTQQRAIVLIGKGQSGVVQGPPGTGKSQTIANLIAQSVADGLRVLFVAEKRAALDAVIKRLNHPDVGLGHLILDLHGVSVSRKEVMARLANALERIRHAQPADGVDTVHRAFEARRHQLNEHARRINVRREPTGMSLNRMIGQLLRLPQAARSSVRVRNETLASLTLERVDAVRQWIRDGAAHPGLLLGSDPSPWNNADIQTGSRAKEAADLANRAAVELWPPFERTLGRVLRDLKARPPASLKEVATLLSVLRDVGQVRGDYSAEVFAEHASALTVALEPARHGAVRAAWAFLTRAEYRQARRRLMAHRKAPANGRTLYADARRIEDVLHRWRELGSVADTPLESPDEAQLATAFVELTRAADALSTIVSPTPFDEMSLIPARDRLRELAADTRTPYLLPSICVARTQLRDAGLARLLDDYREHAVRPEHWVERFEYVWLYSALEQVLASDPSLAVFSGRTHEQLISDFVELDRERVRLAAHRVRRLHAERAIDAQNQHFEQADLVRTQAHKKASHLPLRDLLSRAPDVLTRIAPCWVASPLSVSQMLDGGKQYFDIVVFDEASQVLQEEAIPALYRAGRVVAAGDRHQLPPTTFFATAIEGEDNVGLGGEEEPETVAAAAAAVGGYESLLGTLEAFLPNWMLEWHYRSADERLIAFSNAHIYDGRLITFPSARGQDAIKHVLVAHDATLGGQEESASREVEEVVRQVLLHAEQRPQESLGVITMGVKHANRIQAALDRDLELRPDLSEFFASDREERFFVKNLETVQGDERDTIILSIGYGKAANGDLPHRFGPLTQEAGHRRLNVAVTRARQHMLVISSFGHNEIDLNRSGSRGVQLLKAFLDYAASGGERLPQPEHAGEVPLNAFEADIRDALEQRGIVTRPQFGASRYRIDLVGMHPKHPGRPVLAIECDGASYHSSPTARDRDRLRQAHLQRLGWRFHRIWSTDWFYHREEEIERVLISYRDAVQRADQEDSAGVGASTPAPQAPISGTPKPGPADQSVIGATRGARPPLHKRDNIDEYPDVELRRLAEWIASDGLLRTEEEMIREMFAMLPFHRLGGRIRSRLQRAASAYKDAGRRGA